MSVESHIRELLTKEFDPSYLEIDNESEKHSRHRSSPGTGESHFKVIIVSNKFWDKNRINRHQMIYECLKELINNPIHALSIQAYTVEEFKIPR